MLACFTLHKERSIKMKKKLLVLTLICFLLSLACGCTHKSPKYLPGLNEGDSGFVWVCKEPFGFFYITNELEGHYGPLKGYVWKEGEFVCFYSAYFNVDGYTYFQEEKNWDYYFDNESFSADGYYFENYFSLYIEDDPMNFFDGELPELRFDKMTKEDFLLQYGYVENISELLE